MCNIFINTTRGDAINKKILVFIVLLAVAVLIFIMPISSTYDFDGLFTADLPMGQEYSNVAWCNSNGALGCKNEYWEKDAGCEIDGDEIVIYYYDNSLLCDGESSAWQHAINDLTNSYLYEVDENDGNLVVLTNDIGMRNMPPYLVGKVNNEANKVVFVGGDNLDDLKKCANTIKFE